MQNSVTHLSLNWFDRLPGNSVILPRKFYDILLCFKNGSLYNNSDCDAIKFLNLFFSMIGKILLRLCGLKPFFCKGVLRHRSTREFYSNNFIAVGSNHAQSYTSVEDKTEQKIRQQNKTQGSKQGK